MVEDITIEVDDATHGLGWAYVRSDEDTKILHITDLPSWRRLPPAARMSLLLSSMKHESLHHAINNLQKYGKLTGMQALKLNHELDDFLWPAIYSPEAHKHVNLRRLLK